MKKLSLSILFLCFFAFSKAQWVTIPDTAFVSFLKAQGLTPAFSGNQMDTTHILVISQKTLEATVDKGIKSLDGIQYFDSLTDLSLNNNDTITTIIAFPPLLQILKLPNMQAASMPNLPGSLMQLAILSSTLTSLPPLPSALDFLTVWQSPNLPFPTSLPSNLHHLAWSFNMHKSIIPVLPNSLFNVQLQWMGIDSLVAPLPSQLFELQFQGNHVTTLPPLPATLFSLNFANNFISNIPSLPSSLRYLNCSYTSISALPELPDSMLELNISHSDLQCLPQLKKIANFIWGYCPLSCLPNYPQVNTANPPLTTLPLCDVFNTNGCDVYYNITGELYKDDNSDCVKSTAETNIQNLKVDLYQGGNLQQQGYFDDFYSFNTNYGTFQTSIDTTGLPFIVTCPANNNQTSVITALDSMDYSMDFALQCKPGFDLAAWSMASTNLFRPASTPLVHIKAGDFASFWGQRCNTANLSGQLQITISGPASYNAPAAGALTPTTINGNIITYTIADWSAINPETAFNLLLKIDTAAQAGQSVCLNVNLTPTAGDNNPANNTLSYCFMVVASLDPNNKTVYPTDNVNGSDWLTYTVNFQNTGNSYAQHIYILDTLDSNLDESTFQLLSWSHENQTIVNGNVVRFNFPNINLPDSNANEPASHGYVQYKIKAKENLAPGAHIYNTAYIYFDFNAPVVTNITDNRGCVPDTFSFSQSICNGDTFNFNGQLLTAEGNYLDTLQNQFGCDSIVTLNLQFYPTTFGVILDARICAGDSVGFEGSYYKTPGTYSITYQNIYGCDSMRTMSLEVDSPSYSSFIEIICNGDTFNFNGQLLTAEGSYVNTLQNQQGCDSVVALNLQFYPAIPPTVWNASMCQGDTFHLGSAIYTASGNYSYAFQSMYGCDSVVNLSLTVDALPVAGFVRDCFDGIPAVWDCGWLARIGANFQNSDSLEWHIRDITSGSVDTTVYGMDTILLRSELYINWYPGYFITVPPWHDIEICLTAYNNCGSASFCDTTYLWEEGISETALNNFQLYPNPAKDYVTISAEQNAVGGLLQLRDITGRVISTQVLNSKQIILNTSALAAGVYVVTLQQKNGAIGLKRLVIE